MKSEAAEEEATEALDRALIVGATLLWLLLLLLAAEEVVDEADEDKESRPEEIDNSLLCC